MISSEKIESKLYLYSSNYIFIKSAVMLDI